MIVVFARGPFVKNFDLFPRFRFLFLVPVATRTPDNSFGPKTVGWTHVLHAGDWTNWPPELQAASLGNSFPGGNSDLPRDLRKKNGILGETEKLLRNVHKEWRDGKIQSAYASWRQAGIKPGRQKRRKRQIASPKETGAEKNENHVKME